MYFVTARAFQARMLLKPSDQVNEVIGGVLARAADLFQVELHAFVVTSNHVHLLVTAKGASLSRFMQYFLCNTSRKVGRLVQWTGSLWQRRFSSEEVLDDEAALGRLQYILAHGVKEGLVHHPNEWPGLSCLKLLLEGGSQFYRFFRWAKRWANGALVSGAEDLWSTQWSEQVELTLHPLPAWRGLTVAQRASRVLALVKDIVREGEQSGRAVAGVASIHSLHPHYRPAHAKKSPRPLCHASTRTARQSYLLKVRSWMSEFALASERFRQGDWEVAFPPWAFRPMVPAEACAECAPGS
jgi:REP element-mobilizing transposase RayT